MKCVICSSTELVAKSEIESIAYKSRVLQVPMAFTACQSCGDEFVATEQIRENDRAVVAEKRKADGLLTPDDILVARQALCLTQAEAADAFGGGRNAFSKYERGEVAQSEAMDKLIRICLAHPYLLKELMTEGENRGGEAKVISMAKWRAENTNIKKDKVTLTFKSSLFVDEQSQCYEV